MRSGYCTEHVPTDGDASGTNGSGGNDTTNDDDSRGGNDDTPPPDESAPPDDPAEPDPTPEDPPMLRITAFSSPAGTFQFSHSVGSTLEETGTGWQIGSACAIDATSASLDLFVSEQLAVVRFSVAKWNNEELDIDPCSAVDGGLADLWSCEGSADPHLQMAFKLELNGEEIDVAVLPVTWGGGGCSAYADLRSSLEGDE